MRRDDLNASANAPAMLHTRNTPHSVLSSFNNPHQFSDAARHVPNLTPTDPRMLIAAMTKTRHQCRSTGLIPRDFRELTHIGKNLNLAPIHTRRIIGIALQNPYATECHDSQITQLATIPFTYPQKKTRLPFRVYIGLSIWAITIAVAMQMV